MQKAPIILRAGNSAAVAGDFAADCSADIVGKCATDFAGLPMAGTEVVADVIVGRTVVEVVRVS